MLFPKNIKITILTGFLGSGKTTLLKKLLKKKKIKNILFIINEFGEIGLDHKLIETIDENIVELQNGCICCTIQTDLRLTLNNVLKKMERGQIPIFDKVIIETTGLADPVPIIHTIMNSIDLQRIYYISRIIAIIDTVNGNNTFNNHQESIKQVALADRVILTKLDIAKHETLPLIIKRINDLNPNVEITKYNKNSFLSLEELFDAKYYDPQDKSWDTNKWLSIENYKNNYRSHQHHDKHNINIHGDNIRSYVFKSKKEISISALNFFIEIISNQMGSDLLRIKGILNLKGESRPAVIHGVQHIFHPIEWLNKWTDSKKLTQIVFITKNFSKTKINSFFKILGENEI